MRLRRKVVYKMLNGVGVCARACVRACAGVCVWAYENIMMYTITEAMKNNTQQKYNHFIIEPALVLQNEQLLRKRIITSLSTPSHTHAQNATQTMKEAQSPTCSPHAFWL